LLKLCTKLPGDEDIILVQGDDLTVTGPTEETLSTGERVIQYKFTVTEAGRSKLQGTESFAIYWEALLAIGASKWSGSTLHSSFYTQYPTGKETVQLQNIKSVTPSLKVTKSTVSQSFNSVGDVIDYTITVENTGNVTLTDIVVTDPTATITGGSPIASLAPGATATVTASHTVTQADLDAGKVVNTAKASAFYNETEYSDEDSVTIPAVANPLLRVTKNADVDNYNEVGQVINYTITVKNTGNVTLTDIVVTDPTATITGGSPIASLAPGATATVTASYTVTQADLDAGKVVNTAKASAFYNETEYSDEDSVTIPAVANPLLRVTKNADVDNYNEVGQVINYTITVKNTGNVTLTDIVVTDPKATITGGSPIVSLAPGATATVTASYTVTQADLDAGEVENTATASAKYDEEDVSDEDSVTIEAITGASLKVEKSSEGSFKEAGDIITYQIKVTNNGTVTLTAIQVRDDMLGLSQIIDSLAPGESRTFTETYTVKESDLEGNLVNTASALAVYNDEEIYDEDSVMLIPPEPPLVEPEYTITTQPQPAEGGTTSGDGTYKQGTIITVKAAANTGYIFTGWYENGVKVSDSANYQFTVVQDRHLVAHFQKETVVQPEKPKTDPTLPRTSGMAGALGLGLLLLAGGLVSRRFSR
jgi:uncharacterized repeat protein (TIGR01451 family)